MAIHTFVEPLQTYLDGNYTPSNFAIKGYYMIIIITVLQNLYSILSAFSLPSTGIVQMLSLAIEQ